MTISTTKARRRMLVWNRYIDHYMIGDCVAGDQGWSKAYNKLIDADHYAQRTTLRRRHATLRKVLRKIRRSQQ